MFTTFISCTLLLALAISGAQAGFAINSPELTQCQDAHISWSPSTGPYNLIVVPNDNPCEDVVADLGDHTGTTMTWKVNVSGGQSVLFSLLDSTGEEVWSQVLYVKESNDASCLPGNRNHASSSLPVSGPSSPAPSLPANTIVVPPPSSSPQIVGAAAAGDNPLGSKSGAPSIQVGGPAFAITALAAVAALAL